MLACHCGGGHYWGWWENWGEIIGMVVSWRVLDLGRGGVLGECCVGGFLLFFCVVWSDGLWRLEQIEKKEEVKYLESGKQRTL